MISQFSCTYCTLTATHNSQWSVLLICFSVLNIHSTIIIVSCHISFGSSQGIYYPSLQLTHLDFHWSPSISGLLKAWMLKGMWRADIGWVDGGTVILASPIWDDDESELYISKYDYLTDILAHVKMKLDIYRKVMYIFAFLFRSA
jgi:hypothetical protein